MKKNNLRKKAATAGSVALVAALLLTGTYAWNSISQEALNEDVTYSNPGGRLHDDWAGLNDGTKNVYVENFDDGGKAIYARVKLQTYIESGKDAGKTVDENGKPLEKRAATPLVNGTTIDNKETWPTYTFGEGGANPEIANYLEIKDGVNKKVNYMPTFNKNLESLMADINGTYQGVDGVHFGDYVDYTKAENQKKTGVAYYYSENGTAADGGVTAPGTDKNYRTENEEHTVQTTLETAKIISMKEWLGYDGVSAGQEKTGNYWVYDEDGWFYWAQAIEGQTATGPLITGVEQLKTMGENCYIGINVVGEFASAGDWGDENGGTDAELGFYKNGITENAMDLLEVISNPYENVKKQIEAATLGTTTVTIDGEEFYVMAKKEDQALLLRKYVLDKTMAFGATNSWESSSIRTYLNSTEADGYLYGKPVLQKAVVETTLQTIKGFDDATLVETKDQVFLLSEADVFASSGSVSVAESHYTAGKELPSPGGSWKASNSSGESKWWWLRSPRYDANRLANGRSQGGLGYATCTRTDGGVRPACWVEY